MATAAKATIRPTQAQWAQRSLELAEVQHLTGTARLLAENETHAIYAVRKSAVTGEYLIHTVRIAGEVSRVSCDCVAGAYGRPCKHAGAVLHTLRVRERAISQANSDVFANWRRGGEW
jgi:SWIM zinc finger